MSTAACRLAPMPFVVCSSKGSVAAPTVAPERMDSAMAAIVRRGTKAKPRFYAQYADANGVRRTKLLRGAGSTEQARIMLGAIERNIMQGKLGIEEPTAEERALRSL